MPLYEYYCPKCKHEFELLIRSSDIPVCPDCGNKKLVKEMSTSSARTKNSEFGCKPSVDNCGHGNECLCCKHHG
ncbi:MAG: zinc ribbon domain-containing protein [Planctomycetaceae bacterium]|nr:zinc ribbon domain-containing protein [Planctomycetaceae bacterium]